MFPLLLIAGLAFGAAGTASQAQTAPAADGRPIAVPVVQGKWWQIAPQKPDVGEFKTGTEDACDFAVFQDKNGLWRVVSCIRGTSAPGQRVFHQWTSPKITDENWKPVGLFDVERGMVGKPEKPNSVQAPHPILHNGKYYLFYNSSGARCMISDDGITWKQHKDVNGNTKFFDMGRDVAVFHDEPNKRWIAYYCGNTPGQDGKKIAAMVARTAPTLEGPWSKEEHPVRTDGNPESPYVVRHDGRYYLWQQMSVYISDDPLNFNKAPLVAHMTGTWFGGKYAPEIIEHDGRWYVSGYSRGLYVAEFKWETKPQAEVAAWREKFEAYLKDEEQKRLQREAQRPTPPASQPAK